MEKSRPLLVLAVEVAGADDLCAVGEDDGVVGGAVHLGGDDAAHEVDGVVADAVHLGKITENVIQDLDI